MACDYNGIVRIVFGEEAGSLNDVTLYRRSGMGDDIALYLQKNDQILFDGIYYFMGHPLLCPFTTHNHHMLSDYEKDWNDEQRAARVIIENILYTILVILLRHFAASVIQMKVWNPINY